MKKRSDPAPSSNAFSIASQFTGPPFSVTLESANLRRHLLEEMLQPADKKVASSRVGKAAVKPSAAARKTPGKRPVTKPKKQARD